MKQIMFALVVLVTVSSFAQNTSEVIENGIKVKSKNEIFLQFDGRSIFYQQNPAVDALHFKQVADSLILLPVESSINFYSIPLNPINYSYSTDITVKDNPDIQSISAALTGVISFAKALSAGVIPAGVMAAAAKKPACEFPELIKPYDNLVLRLKDSQKDTIASIFGALKKLDFLSEADTKNGLTNADNAITALRKSLDKVKDKIENVVKVLNSITCSADCCLAMTTQQSYSLKMKDLLGKYDQENTRLINLEKIYKATKAAQEAASSHGWIIKLDEVSAPRDKFSIYAVTVSTSGYELSDDNEIVSSAKKTKLTRVFRVTRFQRFVREVSAGFAYTNLSFPKFGVTTDSLGKQHVAGAGEDIVNKVNFTAMINYNYFIPNSPLHPFWQIGVGANASLPTLFTGVGVRVNSAPAKRLAISIGFASTWIKTLDKLKIGDVVSGQADIDTDVKYKFSNVFQPYLGIQINF
ncbi:hypothetical protein WSM22_37870 [Cytophagales bacterium WSM2-2]|nr:hypothetical protein WSM22_37870 [Cytophagales bacterium WSM2-2]